MKNEKQLVTDDMLVEKAAALLDVASQLKIMGRFCEVLDYYRISGDQIPVNHQISNGFLNDICDNLYSLNHLVIEISNDLCPDMEVKPDEKN